MPLLIDGYNLLNAVGITGHGRGGSSLERSRTALLNFLAESLDAEEVAHTCVVFDAAMAPPGLPRVVAHRGLDVRFAPRTSDADTLLEELIRADHSPRRLTVVSSDHRVQRAARRRRARAVDSDVWYAEILHGRQAAKPASSAPSHPPLPLAEEDVRRWLDRFGGQAELEGLLHESDASSDQSSATSSDQPPELPPFENPFPPGYGEDLLDE